eukprot:gene22848-biopygen22171
MERADRPAEQERHQEVEPEDHQDQRDGPEAVHIECGEQRQDAKAREADDGDDQAERQAADHGDGGQPEAEAEPLRQEGQSAQNDGDVEAGHCSSPRGRTGDRDPALDDGHQRRHHQGDRHVDDGRGGEGLEALIGEALDLLGLRRQLVDADGQRDGRVLEDGQEFR